MADLYVRDPKTGEVVVIDDSQAQLAIDQGDQPVADDAEHPFARWRTVDVLAIDELHADATVITRIRSLLYERWDEGRCTILAGNITTAQFLDSYLSDAALHRRVLEEYPPGGPEWLVTVDTLEAP